MDRVERKTFRGRLTEDIVDLYLFGPSRIKNRTIAKKVMNTVFTTIKKGLERDGVVTIEGFGRFFTAKRWKGAKSCTTPDGKPSPTETKVVTVARWTPAKRLLRSFNEYEEGDPTCTKDVAPVNTKT